MKNITTQTTKETALGNVYIMTHSLFSDVVRIGCTPKNIDEYVKSLSAATPGEYHIAYSSLCISPCEVKRRIKESLNSKVYMNDFYEVSIKEAKSMVEREVLRIPSLDIH